MTRAELDHLELLAEVDALGERLRDWSGAAPPWETARSCRAIVERLLQRAQMLRVRLEAPLVVATIGGSGTGKSALVNALLGDQVVTAGRQRPTTLRPTVVCRPDLTPAMLGIDPHTVDVIHRDLPALADLVLIDCPDPDTTEDSGAAGTNLSRLRAIVPHCDVLLVTTTQQKYRSARVSQELAESAPGARLVFVQTHADEDEDIRADWRSLLAGQYSTGEVFLVDSLAAMADAQAGIAARGEFARLQDLLTRQLAGAAGNRIRRANFLDLVAETLERIHVRLQEALPAVERLESSIQQQQAALGAQLARQTRTELLQSRRQWESRVLDRVIGRWGFSPFSLVLRLYQGLGGLISRAALFRARTPAQMALWGVLEGARTWRHRQQLSLATRDAQQAAACWDASELRSASVVVAGFAGEAGLSTEAVHMPRLADQASAAAGVFAAEVAGGLDSLLDRLATRHTGWFTRWRYELLLLVMLGLLGFRLAKNFFYDSWLAPQPGPVFGMEFYLSAGFWLLAWCLLLLWAFTGRLRRGLRREIDRLTQQWIDRGPAAEVFAPLSVACQGIRRWQQDLSLLRQQVSQLRNRLALPDAALGHRHVESPAG